MKLPEVTISHRTTEPLFKAERPYEDFCINVCSVLHDNGRWHMWYTAYDHTYRHDDDGFFCYARSNDGVRWERPDLGLTEYGGNKHNNILIASRDLAPPHRGLLGPTIFLDEAAPPAERFKLVCARPPGWIVFGGTSPDGVHWALGNEPLLPQTSDTQIVCFRDSNLYRLYVRMWSGEVYTSTRIIGYSESREFGSFPDPVVIMGPEEDDPNDLQFYGSGTAMLENGWYIMFPQGYYTGVDHVLCHVAFSRDGVNFQRLGREPLVGLGQGFDSRCVYVAPGLFPTGQPGSYWVYYLGTAVKHDDNWPDKARYAGGVGRFMLTLTE